jgi:hypothetical protein
MFDVYLTLFPLNIAIEAFFRPMTQLFRSGFEVGEHVDRTLGWPQSGRSAWRMCSLAAAGGVGLASLKAMLGILPKKHETYWNMNIHENAIECYCARWSFTWTFLDVRIWSFLIVSASWFQGPSDSGLLSQAHFVRPRNIRIREPQEHTPWKVKKEPKNCHSDRFWQCQQFHVNSPGCTEPSAQLGLARCRQNMSALNSNCFRFKDGTQMILISNWKKSPAHR